MGRIKKRFIVIRRRSGNMVGFIVNNQAITSNMSYEEKMCVFNQFLDENMDFLDKFLPENPTISKDDEWRTDDYSDYDEIRKRLDD